MNEMIYMKAQQTCQAVNYEKYEENSFSGPSIMYLCIRWFALKTNVV